MHTQLKAAPAQSFMPVRSGLLQRKRACGGSPSISGKCEECSNKQLNLQRSTVNQAEPFLVQPTVREILRSPGQPLDASTRAFMEPRFGHNFGNVRVHTDAKAAESAKAVNALAYTVGRDVVFGASQYAPNSPAGRKLLAHELAHVVQQGGGQLAAENLGIIDSSESAEQGVDVISKQVSQDIPVFTRVQIVPTIARQVDAGVPDAEEGNRGL